MLRKSILLLALSISLGSCVEAVKITMIPVPGGSFHRDGNAENITTLTAFQMSQYEITQAQFTAVTGAENPSEYKGNPNYPVENVSWCDAVEFCNKLSLQEGLQPVYEIKNRQPETGYPISDAHVEMHYFRNGYRLPTEAEWIWAAMGAIDDITKPFAGSDGTNNIADYAVMERFSIKEKYSPVGSKLPNELGLYDMSGNVSEWCWDRYSKEYKTGELIDPPGPKTGEERIYRGGGWMYEYSTAQIARKMSHYTFLQLMTLGFRVVRR